INEYEYIVDAKISIDEFNELIDTDLDDEDYETLGGFLYAQLDKIPNVGDTTAYKNLTFTVLGTRGRRITKVRVEREHAQPTSPAPTSTQETEGQERQLSPLLPPPQEGHTAERQDGHETPFEQHSR